MIESVSILREVMETLFVATMKLCYWTIDTNSPALILVLNRLVALWVKYIPGFLIIIYYV